MLDLSLTSDQEQLVATVRDFCAREFAPDIAANDRAGRHDPEIFAKLASIGLPGVCFPQRYGGYGLDYLSLGLVFGEGDALGDAEGLGVGEGHAVGLAPGSGLRSAGPTWPISGRCWPNPRTNGTLRELWSCGWMKSV